MKLVDVAEFYSDLGGGVRTYMLEKLAAGARMGIETVIVAPGATDREEQRNGGRIVWIKSPKIPLDGRYHIFTNSDAIRSVLNSERPDVVEASSPWVGAWAVGGWDGPALKSLFLHGDPVSAYPHALLDGLLGHAGVDSMFGWFWAYLRKLSGLFDTSVANGTWLADRLSGFGLRRPSPIPFGIDRTQFSPSLRDPSVRKLMLQACGIDDDQAPLLISISRHHPEKHVGTLIDGFRRARREREMGLFLIGDGPLRRWVDFKARRVPRVHVAGMISDRRLLAACLASADGMLHGCGTETYGLVVAEALCSGLPVIVPNSGGALELTGPECAETYGTGDAAGCAQAILRLLDRPAGELHRAALEAASRVGTPDLHFEALFRHYAALVDQRQRRFRLQPNRDTEWVPESREIPT
jgi:alpha-1,6-mannosyltransferase